MKHLNKGSEFYSSVEYNTKDGHSYYEVTYFDILYF